ncbi:MAG: hotdog fold thioesterase [Sphingobacteriales bacterium]|jgi:acyl-CoA thioesterase|nr:hotdog fold thioesterase [Sphingobacteriales bacterium]MBP9142623.1 hotdog fold thioesterase [Chitinophagales bacterium]MDA0199598.1 hotdog fold thioesterase [Bacteroidota bacterium]MBK6891314.1 hotdog fold thioesterase [Sphingobacteriales bacterium]MBK7526855.1 hotdog fold thioesterase [Sphingobacteriales bacterium]
MIATEKAQKVVQKMYSNDAFSQWLGIEISDVEPNHVILTMTIRPEMTNGFAIAHGGITYALADSALAFASNSLGRKAVSIETSINHTSSLRAGDQLIASASPESVTNKIGIYRVIITREADSQVVAVFKGVVYRTEKEWGI